MILSCQICAFSPRDITVKWLKDGSEIQQNSVVNKAETGQDELYQLTTNVKIVLTIADARTKYTCQVVHESLSKPTETHWVAGEVISLPKISEIEADPPCPEIGKPLTLSCTAYGFYPEGNQIFWFKDLSKIQDPSREGIVTEASKLGSCGLYSRSSQWTFIPTAVDLP
ncbi:signal-regulatory protein gamma-like [Hemitrygon akajei]|uniref:signal-regulatory protein gamma-like n=1 Tax=Hemitrygon akajei TaxID=2704970 RepID=UPI003BF9F176